MLLPVLFYEYPYLLANGSMLFNIYTKSAFFHKVSMDYLWIYHLKNIIIVTPDFCHTDFKCLLLCI